MPSDALLRRCHQLTMVLCPAPVWKRKRVLKAYTGIMAATRCQSDEFPRRCFEAV